MSSKALLVTVVLAACESGSAIPLLPSLHGVVVVAASDHNSPSVIDRLGDTADPDCIADAYGGIELTADVAPEPGDETVLVSFTQGVIVLGADGHRIASTSGLACLGSQDELVAVEVVRTFLDMPVIAIAATKGGRRESSTWLELLAVGHTDQLDRLFVGEIERQDDLGTHGGDVIMIPAGLVYRHPINGISLWRYDQATHRFVAPRTPRRDER